MSHAPDSEREASRWVIAQLAPTRLTPKPVAGTQRRFTSQTFGAAQSSMELHCVRHCPAAHRNGVQSFGVLPAIPAV